MFSFKNLFRKKNIKILLILIGGCLYLYSGAVFAATDRDLGSLASGITSTLGNVGSLLGAAAYVAGFGLTIAAIFKFKQHKDNPTQMPLGTPIALLAIGIALVFLPSVITTGGSTVFGTERTGGGFSGAGISGSL